MKLYHVCNNWDNKDLESLYKQYGNEAYDIYAERWPEAGELAQAHIDYIHLYDTLEEAQEHAENFSGEILVVEFDPDNLEIEVERDKLEFNHPMVCNIIPKHLITRL